MCFPPKHLSIFFIFQPELLLRYVKLHKPPDELLTQIDDKYFIALFNNKDDLEIAVAILNILPTKHRDNVCLNLMRMTTNLNQLDFITRYMIRYTNEEIIDLKKVEISLKVFSFLTSSEQDQMHTLIFEPLNIIEVLIMNTKLDKLNEVINGLKPFFENDEFEKCILPKEKIDELLRSYAKKSLDFHIELKPKNMTLQVPSLGFLESIDSLSSNFVMPEIVPDRSEWTPNDEVKLTFKII